jgi:hypothetical protein
MLGRTTRLEFIIVTVAFLVLLLCSKPPRPGTAEVGDPYPQGTSSQETTLEMLPEVPEVPSPDPAIEEAPPVEEDEPSPDSDIVAEPAAPAQPAKRVARVDARRCEGLRYDDVMYGEVTVRWVWNGNKLVPEKVCVVEEPNGVSTVWGFNQQDTAVLSEID